MGNQPPSGVSQSPASCFPGSKIEGEFNVSSRTMAPWAYCGMGSSPTGSNCSCSKNDHDVMPPENSPPRRSVRAVTYVGPYATLTQHLIECKENGCSPLSEARFRQLMTAVEDLSRQGTGDTIRADQELFQGNARDFEQVLGAMGIDIAVPVKAVKKAESGSNISSTQDHELATLDLTVAPESCRRASAVLSDTAFDNRTLGEVSQDVQSMVYAFGRPHDLMGRYEIGKGALATWIKLIADQYLKNPYHNWRHAFDTFQFTYMMMNMGEMGRFFNYQDILALLLAMIAHDVGHLGVNNAHLVNTTHKLALVYNDKAPLENMHAHVFFETLHRPGVNFLESRPQKDYKLIREKIIDAILATDMAQHFEIVDRFTARVSKEAENPFSSDTKSDREKQKSSKGDRRMMLQVFSHTADLGHTCRPWSVHKHLVVLLEEEFFAQGDKERELGLPVMPLMDREKDSAAASQNFFLDKLVRPLLDPFANLLSGEMRHMVMGNLATNTKMWAELVEKHGKLTAAKVVPLDITVEDDDDPTGLGIAPIKIG